MSSERGAFLAVWVLAIWTIPFGKVARNLGIAISARNMPNPASLPHRQFRVLGLLVPSHEYRGKASVHSIVNKGIVSQDALVQNKFEPYNRLTKTAPIKKAGAYEIKNAPI